MSRQPVRLTYEDYLHLPADQRWELIEGVAHVVPSPNRRHQEIADLLTATILFHLREQGGGSVHSAPFDTVLTPLDVVQPDIVFVSDEDMHVLTEDNISGVPTWVIEILSNPYYEIDKLKRYEAAKVPEHWLINPYEDSLAVRILQGSSYADPEIFSPPALVRPHSLESLELDLSEILKR